MRGMCGRTGGPPRPKRGGYDGRRRGPSTLDPQKSTILTKELLALYRRGDTEAERRVFETHRNMLLEEATRHRLMRFLKRFSTPEDVVDEVLLRALSSGLLTDRFQDRGRGSLRKMLSRVLDRVLLDGCRRHGAAKRGEGRRDASLDAPAEGSDEAGSGLPEPVLSGEPTPTSNARASELIELCRRHLNDREWSVWSLIEVEGLDPGAAAERLDESPASVRGVLFRARAKLLKLLGSTRQDEA